MRIMKLKMRFFNSLYNKLKYSLSSLDLLQVNVLRIQCYISSEDGKIEVSYRTNYLFFMVPSLIVG